MKLTQTLCLIPLASVNVAAIAGSGNPIGKPTARFNNYKARDNQYCLAQDISSMNLSGCFCTPKMNTCKTKNCDACGALAPKIMSSCTEGCKDDDRTCWGCSLYYTAICECVRDGKKCTSSDSMNPGGDPVWVFLGAKNPKKKADRLVTTPKPMAGIFEMVATKNQDFSNKGWLYAQTQYDFDGEALALNSYRARTQEQVHIHVCPINKDMKKLLSNERVPDGGKLVQLEQDKTMFCFVRTQGRPAATFAQSLREFFDSKRYLESPEADVCPRFVGAGIMRDDRGNTWACATTNRQGPLPKFCETKFIKTLYEEHPEIAVV
ncbi:hypothetical protein BGZ63DRAFT_365686 [Mariannaea sp. PMI_226]|nr:hypothetical protein BGZ63DRAFT_365686 [Mariannaea sp. PMI_226]